MDTEIGEAEVRQKFEEIVYSERPKRKSWWSHFLDFLSVNLEGKKVGPQLGAVSLFGYSVALAVIGAVGCFLIGASVILLLAMTPWFELTLITGRTLGMIALVGAGLGGMVVPAFAILVPFESWYNERFKIQEKPPIEIGVAREKISSYYTKQFEKRREELLGADSDFVRRKQDLKLARESALESLTFWQRCRDDEGEAPETKATIERAQKLVDTFSSAIEALERHEERILLVIRQVKVFFETQTSRATKLVELERLEKLESQAGFLVMSAGRSLSDVVQALAPELVSAESVLAHMERKQLFGYAEVADVGGSLFRIAEVVGETEGQNVCLTRRLVVELGGLPEEFESEAA